MVQLRMSPQCRMSERQGPENIDCSCIRLLKPHQRGEKAGLIFEKSAEESLIPCTGNSFSPTEISALSVPVPAAPGAEGAAEETNRKDKQKRQIAAAVRLCLASGRK